MLVRVCWGLLHHWPQVQQLAQDLWLHWHSLSIYAIQWRRVFDIGIGIACCRLRNSTLFAFGLAVGLLLLPLPHTLALGCYLHR